MVQVYKGGVSVDHGSVLGQKISSGIGVSVGISLDQKHAPPGRIPIGNSGFYRTPGTISPTDCINYPDSPWCGGIPISSKPLSIGVGVNLHNCGFDVNVSGTLAFIKLPIHGISYRAPGVCRSEPPLPPEPDFSGHPHNTVQSPARGFDRNNVNDTDIVFAAIFNECGIYDNQKVCGGKYVEALSTYKYTGKSFKQTSVAFTDFGQKLTSDVVFNVSYHCEEPIFDTDCPDPRDTGRAYTRQDVIDSPSDNVYFSLSGENNTRFYVTDDGTLQSQYLGMHVKTPNYYDKNVTGETHTFYGNSWNIDPFGKYSGSAIIVYGQWKYIKAFYTRTYPLVFPGWWQWTCFDVIVLGGKPKYNKNPPPPDPNPNKDCCMTCCSPSNRDNNNNDALLRQILKEVQKANKNIGDFPTNLEVFDADENKQEAQTKTIKVNSIAEAVPQAVNRIEKVSKIIGIDALPLTLPKSIVKASEEGIIEIAWHTLFGEEEETIHNLFEYNVWMLHQFSAIMGAWQQEIIIGDVDALKAGNQGLPNEKGEENKKKKIILPDVASTLKEILMLQITIYKTLGLTLDVSLKGLTESSHNAKEIGKVLAEINEIVDFLDYPSSDASQDIPVQITVPGTDVSQEEQNDLYKYLKPSTTKVKYQRWTGEKSLTDQLIHLATLVSRPQH